MTYPPLVPTTSRMAPWSGTRRSWVVELSIGRAVAKASGSVVLAVSAWLTPVVVCTVFAMVLLGGTIHRWHYSGQAEHELVTSGLFLIVELVVIITGGVWLARQAARERIQIARDDIATVLEARRVGTAVLASSGDLSVALEGGELATAPHEVG